MIHIICPFYRQHLLPTIIKYLESMYIHWYPICDPNDIHPFKFIFTKDDYPWIHPVLCSPFNPGEMCYRKINDWLDNNVIYPNDYYGFMGDDDMYEPGFFKVIRKQTAKILVYSCYRGDTTPKNSPPAENHPCSPLIIKTLDDIRQGKVGLGMYMLKGEILRQIKFNDTHRWGDGMFGEELKRRWPDEIKIISDLFVFGNYFEPGRFTSSENFLKRRWKLPEYV